MSEVELGRISILLDEISISLRRIADCMEQKEKLGRQLEPYKAVTQRIAVEKQDAPIQWVSKTIKLAIPPQMELVEYVGCLATALRMSHPATIPGIEVRELPFPWPDDDYRVLLFRQRSKQWTQVYRRLGNSSVLRVTGVETELVVGLV